MNTNVPFRVVIEGTADALFLDSVARDFLARANQYTSITFEAGQSARVPLIRNTESWLDYADMGPDHQAEQQR